MTDMSRRTLAPPDVSTERDEQPARRPAATTLCPFGYRAEGWECVWEGRR